MYLRSDRLNPAYWLSLFWNWVPRAHIMISISNWSFVSSILVPNCTCSILLFTICLCPKLLIIIFSAPCSMIIICLLPAPLPILWLAPYSVVTNRACSLLSALCSLLTFSIPYFTVMQTTLCQDTSIKYLTNVPFSKCQQLPE